MSNDAGGVPVSPALEPPEPTAIVYTDGRARLLTSLALVAIVGLAIVLRMIQLSESLWLDELHTAWIVADGPAGIYERAAIGNQSAPWFFLVWATTRIGGLNEIALRLPSVVAGVGLVILAFYVARDWTGQWLSGLFVALLVALDRNCIFYAQEARPYAWVQLIGLAQVFVFYCLVHKPVRRNRIAFIALTVTLFYLHYTSVLVLAAEAVYYVLLSTRRSWHPRYRWPHFLLDLSLAVLCMLPASWHILEIAARRDNWAMFIQKRPVQDVWYLFPLYLYLQVPLQIVGVAYLVRWVTSWLKSFFGIGAAAKHSRRWFGDAGDSPTDAASQVPESLAGSTILCVCWLFVPLLLAWALTYLEFARLFFLRYLVICALAPILLCGLAVAVCPWRLFRVIIVIAVVWLSVSRGGIIEQYRHDGRVIGDRNQDWRAAVAAVNEDVRHCDLPVFVRSGLIEAAALRSSGAPSLRMYCLLPVRGIYNLQRADDLLSPLPIHRSGMLSSEQRRRLQNFGGGWFILAGSAATISSIESELLGNWDASRYQAKIAERQAFGYVTVLRLAIDSDSSTSRTEIGRNE